LVATSSPSPQTSPIGEIAAAHLTPASAQAAKQRRTTKRRPVFYYPAEFDHRGYHNKGHHDVDPEVLEEEATAP
jgi:hypothetical protein